MKHDVVSICADLIRIDTSNFGQAGSKGERAAADYIAELLTTAGYAFELLESEPSRANLVLRVPGRDRDLPALLVHGHLDVVPADPEQWSVPAFGGDVADGYLWGRGASDMKDMVAMMVATLLDWADRSYRPRRDIVFAFVADEEEDGALGAEWLVRNHPALFDGVQVAIGEAGGFGVEAAAADGSVRRIYPVAVAERGSMHMRVIASGTAGHGSRPNPDNPVVHLVEAFARIAAHRWPLTLTPATRRFLELTTAALGHRIDLGTEEGVAKAVEVLGPLQDFVVPSLRPSTSLTVLDAGYKFNVIPSSAGGQLDVRSLPGTHAEQLAIIDDLLGHQVRRELLSDRPAIAAPDSGQWFDAMAAAIRAVDPDAVVVPYCMGGGTDAKPFAELGIAGYGFSPRGIDPDGRTDQGMHGVDERLPVSSLRTGLTMLQTFLTTV
ncbi:M20/M25/M40 family metallo-hydrolase [Kribbella sp. NPDC048928]|uniref:M20/M25/M40 family metallo-hydrolase n=1 Tax=Kribbella sp. NPDC048928 TaxID=3364111 RepID=UPI00372366D1